jgi:predicted small integral membrane protein
MRSGQLASNIRAALGLACFAGIFGWVYASGDVDMILPLLMLTTGLSELIRVGTTTESLSRGRRLGITLWGCACVVLAFSALVQHQSLAWFGIAVALLAFVASMFARRVLDGHWFWSGAGSAPEPERPTGSVLSDR